MGLLLWPAWEEMGLVFHPGLLVLFSLAVVVWCGSRGQGLVIHSGCRVLYFVVAAKGRTYLIA